MCLEASKSVTAMTDATPPSRSEVMGLSARYYLIYGQAALTCGTITLTMSFLLLPRRVSSVHVLHRPQVSPLLEPCYPLMQRASKE